VSVFADTSGLYAFVVRSDAGHGKAQRVLRGLWEAGRVVRTTSYVVIETTALLQSRSGLAAAHDFHEAVLPLIDIEWVGESLHRSGVARWRREDRRSLSLVDAISFTCMDEHGIRDAFTLDPDFDHAGFKRLLRG